MATERVYRVTVTFDSGVKASVWTSAEPFLPPSVWAPDTISSIGEPGGPQVEFMGRELTALTIVRELQAPRRPDARVHLGAD